MNELRSHTTSKRRPPCPGVEYATQPEIPVGPDHRWYWNEAAWRWECWDCEAYSPRKYDPVPDEKESGL